MFLYLLVYQRRKKMVKRGTSLPGEIHMMNYIIHNYFQCISLQSLIFICKSNSISSMPTFPSPTRDLVLVNSMRSYLQAIKTHVKNTDGFAKAFILKFQAICCLLCISIQWLQELHLGELCRYASPRHYCSIFELSLFLLLTQILLFLVQFGIGYH